MEPGYHVVRMPSRGSGRRMHIESVPFRRSEETLPGAAMAEAARWRDFIQSEYPKDDVFIIERVG